MKKYALIVFAAFCLGLLVAGYLFLSPPRDEAPSQAAAPQAAVTPPLTTGLYAAPVQAVPAPDFVSIANRVSPAVVQIAVIKTQRGPVIEQMPFDDFWNRFFGRPSQPREFQTTAQGTGFFISPDGDILTNNHIVEDGTEITVTTLQGQEFKKVKLVGRDPLTDLALLRVDTKDAAYVEFGASADLQVGEWVLAIGNPFGLEHSVTAGIVSAKGRSNLDLPSSADDIRPYQDFIQTDAAINRGNSGGPLVNMRAQVVGITSNILAPSGGNIGIGFAIPSDMAVKVVQQLREHGRVVRGWLGVSIINITGSIADQLQLKDRRGALVSSVEEGSPAEKGGLRAYDVIVEVGGEPVDDPDDLRFRVADLRPGREVELTVIREGKQQTLKVKVGELEPGAEEQPKAGETKDLGLQVRALTPELARRYGLSMTEGLLITQVEESSEAARRGLQPGMVIVEMNRRKMETVRDFEAILSKVPSGNEVLLLVRFEVNNRIRQTIVTLRVP